ncbi:MAG: oxygenase MpaB family protein [Microthrixaceae bacterium]
MDRRRRDLGTSSPSRRPYPGSRDAPKSGGSGRRKGWRSGERLRSCRHGECHTSGTRGRRVVAVEPALGHLARQFGTDRVPRRGRALLMQVAHPAVGAGVEQHSSYAKDPWGRFFRTVDVMMKLAFAPPEVSQRQQRMLDRVHRRAVGTTDDGARYSAHDPALQLWVWATLVETAAEMYQRCVGSLSVRDRERYYQESKLVAYGCGVPEGACPTDWASFEAYIDGVVENDLRVTPSARAVATAALVPPLPFGLSAPAAIPQRLVTVGLLPPKVRDDFGFDWSTGDQHRLDHLFTTLRMASRLSLAPLRRLPAEWTIRQDRPLRIPWLQRRGGELTTARLAEAGYRK